VKGFRQNWPTKIQPADAIRAAFCWAAANSICPMGKGDTLAPEHTRSGGNGVDLGKVHLATAHEGMDIFIANGQELQSKRQYPESRRGSWPSCCVAGKRVRGGIADWFVIFPVGPKLFASGGGERLKESSPSGSRLN
jgi:hypothetical protein